ncbi:MAG: glycosyltransferase family 4 protein [Thermovirga sp.]
MRIAQILPEFHEGGVERHVLWLSNALAKLGHDVTVISAGGKLEEKLDPGIDSWKLPVHKKNPLTAIYSAVRIAERAKREGWDILHAHSRVPAWIAWWTASMAGIPWTVTAHARYSLNYGLRPIREADGAICVSLAVEEHLKGLLPKNSVVIRNGLPPSGCRWKGSGGDTGRLLFVGRLTRIKGLHVALEALSGLRDKRWSLAVLGDGPRREELEDLSRSLGIYERVRFHGFCDDPDEWMAKSDLLLFPSLDEGLGLVLMQAIRIGLPVLASDIEPVRELVGDNPDLLPPGDVLAWEKALKEVFDEVSVPRVFDPAAVPADLEMAGLVETFYGKMILPQSTSGNR